MNLIYNNKEVSVYVGKLQGILNGKHYDFSSLYQTSKTMFSSNGLFYPFSVLMHESEKIKVTLLSFADKTFKEFEIQEITVILVLVHSNNITKENIQQITSETIATLDVARIVKAVREFNEKLSKASKDNYYMVQFCNMDNAAEAASIIEQADNSYLLKENGKYILLWSPSNKPDDITLAQVYDFADSRINIITPLQLYSKLEYADDIIIENNAVQHLSCI